MSQERLIESFCSKLPPQVQEIAMGSTVENASDDDAFMFSFLQTNLKNSGFAAFSGEAKYDKIFNLFRMRKEITKKPRSRKTQLSMKEKRELGLFKLKRKGMKYSDFLPLHQLWKDYFTTVLDIEGLQRRGFTADPANPLWDDVTRTLLKADYHGAILTVKKSTCSSLVGKAGIVVLDMKNTFKLLGEDNILRTIPKQSSVFCLKLKGYVFTILGSHFCIKPSDRSSKKIKSYMNLSL